MPITRLSILGVGLLGGSLGLAAKSAINHCRATGYGHRASTLETAMQIGAIDEAADDPAAAVRDADLVVLCTPVGTFRDLLGRISSSLKSGAIVTDVGSTKRSIVEQAERLLPDHSRFVGSHPMAGSEKRGVEFARTDLFQNALCITTPTPRTDPDALEQVEQFWQMLGMRITRLDPADHDRLLADVSHLPHVVAAAVVAMQEEGALELAGRGFLDATRIAGGDGGLWRDILLDNRDNVRDGIHRLQQKLEEFEQLLGRSDDEQLRQWLDRAAARREKLLQSRLRDLSGE